MPAGNLYKKIIKLCVPVITLFIIFCSGIFCHCLAQQATGKDKIKRIVVNKEITGTITWLGRERIAITLSSDKESRDEKEMLLPFEKDVKIAHKKSLAELSAGDTVRVQYEETTEKYPDSNSVLVGRKVKVISFVRAKEKKLEEGSVLRSQEREE